LVVSNPAGPEGHFILLKTYPGNDLLNTLLVTLHFQEGPDLANSQILAVPEGDDLIKGADELEGIAEDLALVERLAAAGNDLGEEVEGVDVLEDVGLLVGDKHHVQLVQRLVNEADIVLLDGGMLGTGAGSLGERCEQSLDARPLDVVECPRKDGLAATRANGGGQDNLVDEAGVSIYSGLRNSVVMGQHTILAGVWELEGGWEVLLLEILWELGALARLLDRVLLSQTGVLGWEVAQW
jgi:hypothetical protein